MNALAGLSPDTDKATLMSAVDDAVKGIVQELDSQAGGKVPPDVRQATEKTLAFLEACGDLKDPEFTQRARIRASELLEAYGKVSGGEAAGEDGAPKKKRRRKKRPTGADAKPARAAKGKPGARRKGPPPKAAARPKRDKPWDDTPYTEAFTANICKYLRKRAMLWYVPQHKLTPTPFPLSTKFGDNLETAIKQHFLHRFFANRRIMVLEDELKPKDYAESAFVEIFDKPKKANPVRSMWEDGLNEIYRLLTDDSPAQPKAVKAKTTTKKTGGFLGFFQKEEKVIEREAETDTTELDHAKGFWNTIAGPEVTYSPPTFDDFVFLKSLFEYYPDQVDEEQQAVKQMLQQEYGSNQAREGAARDHLNALIKDTAPCSGELTALWAYLSAKDAFGYNVFKSFTSSHGTSPEQRKRALPYFLRWVPDFTEQEAPSRL
ncbi:MAG: hypothetical protein CMM61_04965 [Rhodospirillaceae bacterium]|nr:hypothetical protein [Rhodospirillaceae bacterium]